MSDNEPIRNETKSPFWSRRGEGVRFPSRSLHEEGARLNEISMSSTSPSPNTTGHRSDLELPLIRVRVLKVAVDPPDERHATDGAAAARGHPVPTSRRPDRGVILIIVIPISMAP